MFWVCFIYEIHVFIKFNEEEHFRFQAPYVFASKFEKNEFQIDKQLESGEYFLSERVREMEKRNEKRTKQVFILLSVEIYGGLPFFKIKTVVLYCAIYNSCCFSWRKQLNVRSSVHHNSHLQMRKWDPKLAINELMKHRLILKIWRKKPKGKGSSSFLWIWVPFRGILICTLYFLLKADFFLQHLCSFEVSTLCPSYFEIWLLIRSA